MESVDRIEEFQAVERAIAAWLAALHDAKLAVRLHRDVLNSPAETLTSLEAQAMRALKAVEWLNAQRQQLAGVAVSA